MAYEYDLFISYRRRGDVQKWVQRHFHPRLIESLTNELAWEPRVWLDVEQEEGVQWQANISRALLRSKYLLAVWTPDYFRSTWCLAEWRSMLAREEVLGMRSVETPRGLVYPIRFSDGKHFHVTAKATECKKDFSTMNYPYESWTESSSYLAFHDLVRDVASELSDWLADDRVPTWSDDWPLRTPKPMDQARATLPEL
jgi:TIR domain